MSSRIISVGGHLLLVASIGTALLVVVARLGSFVVPAGQGRLKRKLAGATLALGALELCARGLAAIGRFRPPYLLVATAGGVLLAHLVLRPTTALGPAIEPPEDPRAGRLAAFPVAVGLGAVGLALVAAGYLPVWTWDAASYHLPFVNLLVQAGASAAVPRDVPYVGTYPHDAEYLFAVFRALQLDDTWLDAAQVPFGLLAAGATALLARWWGASRPLAWSAGALWLAAPAVFLQLPSGYVDVCVAAFLLLSVCWILEAPAPAPVVLAGVSLGLLLGSKPNAALPVAILLGWLVFRSWRHPRWLVPSLLTLLALGLPDYAFNWSRFGNPWWPVALDLGPLHLPGTTNRAALLAAGARAARLSGAPWLRVLRSWSALRSPPAFDMRIGGFGSATVLLGFPGALWALRRRPAAAIALAAGVAGPDPATARFVLAFPALCLALAAGTLAKVRPAVVAAVLGVAGVLGMLDLLWSAPALSGEGPPLWRYPAMSEEQRLRAVGPDGSPGRWIDLRRKLAPGEAIAFDRTFDLSYLLWRRHLQNRVVSIADGPSPAEVATLIDRAHVRFLIAGDRTSAGALARARRYHRLFTCGSDPCAVYETLRAPGERAVR